MADTIPKHKNSRANRPGERTEKSIEKATNPMTNIVSKTKYLIATAATLAALPFAASAQDACSVYSVKQGDTLALIAQAAYGTFDYQSIFNANRNEISNPNRLEVGTSLQLPCADGSLPGGVSAQEIIATQEAEQAARPSVSNAFEPPIKIVSGNGWAPFVGEEFTGGGMLVRMATTALNRGGNAREYSVSFVDDWASHTETLLPLGAFDVSIAWYMPDCSKIDMLSDGMKKRCTELDGSLPIYESVVGFYAMKGSDYDGVRDFADYAGARICRPEGWYTFDLEEKGLIEPVVTMVFPKSLNECFEMMVDGEVDVVPTEIENGASIAQELGVEGEVAQNPYLTNFLNLSFVTHKTNPRGRVYLAMLNRGLTEMRESGEWYAIVSSGLAEHNNLNN